MTPEEDKIRSLFQEMKEEDERNAPSFAHDWRVALSWRESAPACCVAWRLVASVATVLIFLGAVSWMFFRQSTGREASIEIARSVLSTRDAGAAILISQWRSPTESLLRTPGEHLVKRVPRLDDSVVHIKAIVPDTRTN
jgi:hypothetical protein